MFSTLLRITNYLFPSQPAIEKIKNETKESFSRFYSLNAKKNFIYLSNYEETIVSDSIKANKFHNYKPASFLLASLVENWLKTREETEFIFIPIPLGEKRFKERGFNQVTRVLEGVVSDKNITIKPLLKRMKETAPQTKLHRSFRLDNIKNAFSVDLLLLNKNHQEFNPDGLFIIFDDVVTTGATLKEAYETLRKEIPEKQKVLCLSLAH